jgi:biotin operon repressor
MSAEALIWADQQHPRTQNQTTVLFRLAGFASPKFVAWPKQSTLAEACRLSPRAVWQALKELEEDGYLLREHERRHDGRQATNRYYLDPPRHSSVHQVRAGQCAPGANPITIPIN